MNTPAQRLDKFDLDQKFTSKGDTSSLEFSRFLRQLGQIINFQGRLSAPSAQAATASPYVVSNNTGNDESVIVQGGTVSKVEFIRNAGAAIDTGVIAGMFQLSPLDSLRITYTVAPTINVIVR